MPKLARRLRNPEIWARLFESPADNRDDYPPEVVADVSPGGGLSVYLVNEEVSLERIAAALLLSQVKIKERADFIIIDEDRIKGCEVDIAKTSGDVFDEAVMKAHRDLRNISLVRMRKLIDCLISHGEAETISANEAVNYVYDQLVARRMKSEHVFTKRSSLDHRRGEILLEHWKKGILVLQRLDQG